MDATLHSKSNLFCLTKKKKKKALIVYIFYTPRGPLFSLGLLPCTLELMVGNGKMQDVMGFGRDMEVVGIGSLGFSGSGANQPHVADQTVAVREAVCPKGLLASCYASAHREVVSAVGLSAWAAIPSPPQTCSVPVATGTPFLWA